MSGVDAAHHLRSFLTISGWPGAIAPDYAGGSVGNLAASVLEAFGIAAPAGLLPALRPQFLDSSHCRGARVVALVVIDGLGWSAWRAAREHGDLPGLHSLTDRGAITSVFPSTTVGALTSIQSGAAPAQHGIVGYTMHLPAVRRVVNMVYYRPVDGGSFSRPAPDPARLVTTPSLFALLEQAGITSTVVSHREFRNSPLTQIHSGATPYLGHRTPAEFATLLRRATEQPGRRFVFGYWAGIDMLAHSYGPASDECLVELQLLDQALDRLLLGPLRQSADDVAVLVTADHGHVTTAPQAVRSLQPLSAAGGWRFPPTGERRAVGLAFRHPIDASVIRDLVGESGTVLDARAAIDAGLYGPPPHHPELIERIGDWLVLARDQVSFSFRAGTDINMLVGAHGSLTPDEMYVPLLVGRFGAPSGRCCDR